MFMNKHFYPQGHFLVQQIKRKITKQKEGGMGDLIIESR